MTPIEMRSRRNPFYPRLLSRPALIILMTCCFFELTAASKNTKYEACKQEVCGNVSIKYPFWIKNDFCGLGGFQIECNSGQPWLDLIFGHYLIQRNESIHYEKESLELKAMPESNASCLPEFPYSGTPPPPPPPSTGLDFTSWFQVNFLYHCNNTFPYSPALPLTCSSNGTNQSFVAFVPWSDLQKMGPMIEKTSCKSHFYTEVQLKRGDFDYKKFFNDSFTLKYWTWTSERCWACQFSGGVCGQSEEEEFQCFCSDSTDPETCSTPKVAVPAPVRDGRSGLSLGLPFVIGATALLLLSVTGFLCWIRRGRRLLFCKGKYDRYDSDMENFYESFKPKRFSYSTVKRMTNSFREKLGQGGFGAVYKGELPDGTLVAVKLLNSSKGDGQEFINEVASISRTSHVNVVSLLGFCFEGHRRALIYEYMSNGSLDKFIYDDKRNLGWERLYNIAVGIARGLEYLHRGCNTRILHFDIKPQNILLDRDFCPKISDFGLSKLCLGRDSVVSMLVARGTIGYIAPEVVISNFRGVSHKSDVYSYRMMLIEMIGGRKILDARADQSSEVYFHDQVYRLVEQWHELGFAPEQVSTPEQNEIARKMAFVGLWCIQGDPSVRPSMSRVIEMLEGSTESLQIPPKPFLFSPAISRPMECSSSTS